MRTAIALLTLALVAGAYLWTRGGSGAPPEEPITPARTESAPPAGPETRPGPAAADAALDDRENATPRPATPPRTLDPGPPLTFKGTTLIQHDASAPVVQAYRGTIDAELLLAGSREPLSIPVNEGLFQVEVPTRSRLRLLGGTLDGSAVVFKDPSGPFTPTNTAPWALVGVVVPRVEVRVLDGATGAPLPSVTLRKVSDVTSPTLEGSPRTDAGTLLAEDQPSPAVLPPGAGAKPTWIRVSADGRAATHVMIDPRVPATHDVALWPSADLDLTIGGTARERATILVVTRDIGGVREHAGTFSLDDPAVERGPRGMTVPLRGLAAVPHVFAVKGMDRRGRVIALGETELSLGAGQRSNGELLLR